MKKFMQFSISVLCLTIAALVGFHIGSGKAQAQSGTIVSFASGIEGGGVHYVILSNGDVYRQRTFNQGATGSSACDGAYGLATYCAPPDYIGNFWTGTSPVGLSPASLGTVKSNYRK
jgi:hypothetical protein